MEIQIKQINTENPNQHWEFIECNDAVVLDLGCGRWEHVEHRDPSWPTTPEYLIQKGASKVYALDSDSREYEWFNNTFSNNEKIVPILGSITSAKDAATVLKEYTPTVVKMDIEGFENSFLDLSNEEFSSVNFYAIEAHNDDLFNRFVEKFNQCGYKIVGIIELTHAHKMKVIFAKKYE